MEYRQKLNKLYSLYQSQKFDVNELDYTGFKYHTAMLERIAEVENRTVAVFDLAGFNYLFIRSAILPVLGYDPAVPKEIGPDFFFSIMHKDDIPAVIDTLYSSFAFLLKLPPSERKDYKLIVNFRLKNCRGEYLHFVQQRVVLELDSKDNIWLEMIIIDYIPEKSGFKKVQKRLMNLKNGRLYLFKEDKNKNPKTILSKREIEILDFISKGYASKEIAEQLFISLNTVNNHRRNILEKMNADNIAEALLYARKLSLI